jgi:monoglucosyldiacylglycerol epimerase
MKSRKTIAMTGAGGAFGFAMKTLLEKEGAIVIPLKFGLDWHYKSYSGVETALRNSDVLILSHGSKLDHAMEANCDSFRDFIELFISLKSEAGSVPEIWALGSEIEFHPTFGSRTLQGYSASKRRFADYAANLYRDSHVVYRHIVPAAFRSPMGPGLMSASTAASIALWLVRKEWKYIPVTYTGIAVFNYFRFRHR